VSWTVALLIFVSLASFVAGQLLLKRAMEKTTQPGFSRGRFAVLLAAAIAAMTVNFFLNLGLLQRFDLSYFFPFQGLSVILITATAALVLQEKITLRLTIGALIISGGVMLVSAS
jgi:drug/metabolite transporter (DMT)-like permease